MGLEGQEIPDKGISLGEGRELALASVVLTVGHVGSDTVPATPAHRSVPSACPRLLQGLAEADTHKLNSRKTKVVNKRLTS